MIKIVESKLNFSTNSSYIKSKLKWIDLNYFKCRFILFNRKRGIRDTFFKYFLSRKTIVTG